MRTDRIGMIAEELVRISNELLSMNRTASRRSRVRIFIDENLFGQVVENGLRQLGYNQIKTFPSGTKDQVIHDELNAIATKLKTKPVLLITKNPNDFTLSSRKTKPLYVVLWTAVRTVEEKIPAMVDNVIRMRFNDLKPEAQINLKDVDSTPKQVVKQNGDTSVN